MNPSTSGTARRCSATSKRSGERCRGKPILGGTVCWKHGGAARQTRAKARERLDMLAEPAVVLIGKILRDEKVAPADRIRAALGVLDRTGFPAGLKIDAELDHRMPGWKQVLDNLWQQSEVEQRKQSAVPGRKTKAVTAKPAAEPVVDLAAIEAAAARAEARDAALETTGEDYKQQPPKVIDGQFTSADETLPQPYRDAGRPERVRLRR